MRFLDIPLLATALPVLTCTGYLFTLTILSARTDPPPHPEPRLRFDIVVPAHNEEQGIATTIANLRQLDYPAELVRIIVVADNCTDDTAVRARKAGARVLVRDDTTRQGKGYALEFAFAQLVDEAVADAVVVVDADSQVSANFLRAFSARFERGAPAVQVRYGVRNRDASWRTRLMSIAFATFHDLRSLGRERLGLSCGLRGNGMGFLREVLREVPHDAFSIVEDIEYGIALARKGHRIWYVDEADVVGDMAASEGASRSQRQRWEGGRWKLAKKHGLRLFREAIRNRDRALFDVAVDVIVPPLSTIVIASLAGTLASGIAVASGTASPIVLVPWGASLLMLGVYVVRGVVLSGTGLRGFVDLAAAPAYIAWKIAFARSNAKATEWIRTTRPAEERA
jgi:cellulose synthase/poly-beta-1,6-N-acetylglucosamine synthase-like glycosyltransferase